MNSLPTLSLAPMQDVSVLPLWRCLERRGGPDLYVTEYFRVHRDSHPERKILRSITEMQERKPVVAQLIGNEPEHLARTADLIQESTSAVGIDINLGCPAPKVCGKLAGGALLRDLAKIEAITIALRPVVKGRLTLKTRLGFESHGEFSALLDLFAELPIDGLAIHGRTVREKYQTPIHPESIAEAVERLPYPVTANGNIVSVGTAQSLLNQTKAAGLMIGRGGIRNPWLFAQIRSFLAGEAVTTPSLRDVCDYLIELSQEVESEGNFPHETSLVNRLKKFSNYITSGIAEGTLNRELRRATSKSEFFDVCHRHLDSSDPFPEEPEEDGKLFCGFRELNELAAR